MLKLRYFGVLVCLLVNVVVGSESRASQFDDCIAIKEKHDDASARANAVLSCLEALANSQNEKADTKSVKIAFVRPQYGPTWATYSGYRNYEYAKDDRGMVYLRGMMSGCVSDTVPIFTLPEGFRPIKRLIFSTMGGASHERARVDVNTNGGVFFIWSARKHPCPAPAGEPPMWLTLEGMSFQAEK